MFNKSWEQEKKALHKHRSLYFNKRLLKGAPKAWDETAIEEQSKQLELEIVKIWTVRR